MVAAVLVTVHLIIRPANRKDAVREEVAGAGRGGAGGAGLPL